MPRLLPRLLKWLESNQLKQPEFRGPLMKRRLRRRSLWRPLDKTVDATFSLLDRQQSLLLDQDNILTSPNEYIRHRSLPPVVHLQDTQKDVEIDYDHPREMSVQERQWWSSPYLRMLSTPIRTCFLSDRHLPSDFLIRFVILTLPTTSPNSRSTALVPDGLLHPKFANRIYNQGLYIACSKDALTVLRSRGDWSVFGIPQTEANSLNKAKQYAGKFGNNISIHSLLSKQIAHQLRQRVLQELEMLSARLKAAPRKLVDDTVIRRLTRSEWTTMKSSGHIPWEGAAFVIVAPPVNRNPETNQRPRTVLESPLPAEFSDQLDLPEKSLPPLPLLSTLSLKEDPAYDESIDFLLDSHLPHSRVPIYNALSLFPERTSRAVLHEKLCEVLNVERSARWRINGHADGDLSDKPSHAFIVFSSARHITRVDSVPLAVALWRVRMWEGAGWGDSGWMMSRES
ncbi:hypothetical protein EW145_g138 [Phellinidium pouzarii]|uniref:Uncharacterized protein n=1 Tax=Phellinidium pouzarii TaxID=167371 RepID=A0A4S4LLB8_9AGAM|nr:hypothetical protein EW145_g138 [Phellinidium pouzarii]